MIESVCKVAEYEEGIWYESSKIRFSYNPEGKKFTFSKYGIGAEQSEKNNLMKGYQYNKKSMVIETTSPYEFKGGDLVVYNGEKYTIDRVLFIEIASKNMSNKTFKNKNKYTKKKRIYLS